MAVTIRRAATWRSSAPRRERRSRRACYSRPGSQRLKERASRTAEDTMVDIIHRIGIKAPLSRVYEALATVEGVAGWWTDETVGVSKPGGTFKVIFRSHGDEKGR